MYLLLINFKLKRNNFSVYLPSRFITRDQKRYKKVKSRSNLANSLFIEFQQEGGKTYEEHGKLA